MIPRKSFTPGKYRFFQAEVWVSLGLFLLALAPRAYDLPRFVTADEAKWVYRSARFLLAFLQGDLAGTTVNLTPAVTTTWLGSLGLWLYYQLHAASLGQPLAAWLESLPEFDPDLTVLVAARWPMVIFTTLGVVAGYHLARPLFGRPVAVLAAGFIALDPHLVALSRILGHDALTAVFMGLSLLLLLLAATQPGDRPSVAGSSSSWSFPGLILSGIMAGLAFLSKAPALFLVPFAGLFILSRGWRSLIFQARYLLIWGLAAYLSFVLFWPAAWVDPLGRPLAVAENAFLSATDTEEAEDETYWRVPELGPFYYLVNGGFKLSPLVMVGLGLALIPGGRRRTGAETANLTLRWLWLFILLFTLFMTLGEKRSVRYLLPIFPVAAVIAASGWLRLYQKVTDLAGPQPDKPGREGGLALLFSPRTFLAVLLVCAGLVLLPYIPYYFTYFNPLMGGSVTAPYLVKIGWGEGLDRVGRFLQRELRDSRVGTAYASTLAPYFEGKLTNVTAGELDFVVLYLKQVQGGEPSPAFIRYFEQTPPIFSVELNGIDYAKVYPGPTLRRALAAERETASPAKDSLIPTDFRALRTFGSIGEPLEVEVVWQAGSRQPFDKLRVPPFDRLRVPLGTATLTLQPEAALDRAAEEAETKVIFAEAQGQQVRQGGEDSLILSRHQLHLPETLERGTYALLVEGYPLGTIDLRQFQLPAELNPVENVLFADQIALRGYQFEPNADYVGVTVAWQALKSGLPDYTVFVQLLEAESQERRAGVDLQPLKGEWPTSRWARDELVVDEYLVAVPPDLRPGAYLVIIGLYQPQTGQRLSLGDGRDYWLVPWTFIRKE